MAERMRRVKTGCLTCRKRRVKCDERKPTCLRCEVANVECDGYQSPRRVTSKSHTSSEQQSTPHETASLQSSRSWSANSPLVAYPNNPSESQRPHQRAREVLAHQQYSFKTVTLLFREDHLYFWRDHLLEVAWDTEFVYDAVVALGTMHRAVLLLSKPEDKWRGLDTKVVSFQVYGNALKQMSGRYESGQEAEIVIAVLILLIYFEIFAGNAAAAFGYLRRAGEVLSNTKSMPMSNREPLIDCVNELIFNAQIVLPLPELGFNKVIDLVSINREFKTCASAAQELQQLLKFISAHREINQAIWTPLSNTEDDLNPQVLAEFQTDLLRWKTESKFTFLACRESTEPSYPDISTMEWSSIQAYTFPPKPHNFPDMDSALAAVLFNCYMGRTMWMISRSSNDDEGCQLAAYWYAYHNLQIVEGIWEDKDDRRLEDRKYLPCNAVKIGLTPLLFLSAHFSYDSTWRQWIKGKLYSIGSEGLYNGEAYAASLESLNMFQSHVDRNLPLQSEQLQLGFGKASKPMSSSLVPIIIPDTKGQTFVTYYARALGSKNPGERTPCEIVGRARWSTTSEDTTTNLSIEFFSRSHAINQGLPDGCIYQQLAMHEPIAQEWKLFSHRSGYESDTACSSVIGGTSHELTEMLSPFSTYSH